MTRESLLCEPRVLSTLNANGSRRWLHPRPSRGRLYRARRILAYGLIAVFTLVPYLSIGSKPAVLLDISRREFTLLGFTFLPTDTVLLALLLVTLILGICLATAILGRVWCGWMCPQTVYMEFVYRPLERLFDGPPGPRQAPGKRSTPGRILLKYAIYVAVSAYLAHTFLAYFVGVETLAQWVERSPLEHPISFLVMAGVTGLMMFDFSYFREQTCIVACPYGRFQSVMLDRDSLIVSYDPKRGEPRGRAGRGSPDPALRGHCIDCGQCTDTCPTGIDIRDGLQLECIACAQCIDACDAVMDRRGKPRGLIRMSSQSRIEDAGGRWLRPRLVLYAAVMLALLTVLGTALVRKQSADVTLLRGRGAPFHELAPGEITNQIGVKITNRSGADAAYRIEAAAPASVRVVAEENPVLLKAGQSRSVAAMITIGRGEFQGGRCDVTLRISDGDTFSQELDYRLLGPQNALAPAASDGREEPDRG
ncbi:MAG: cytochrome c oxidase accessory protein CcoG [Pirellulales bacterium]|nr:cytochrome c oxidase accessory protein CcoG [Pirellulales bacterium]